MDDDDAPLESVDWTEHGAVTSVKNQDIWGNCYAQSTVASSIESLFKIKNFRCSRSLIVQPSAVDAMVTRAIVHCSMQCHPDCH